MIILDRGENRELTVTDSLTLISILTKDTHAKRTITLKGKGSSYTEHTLIVGDKQFDVTTDVITDAPNSNIDVNVRGVITGTGKAVVHGNLRIKKGAVKSESKLSQHLLLASQDAKAEAIPDLEIDENDVKAGHAATVRPLNPEHLFYLESRGLSPVDARKLLLTSFLLPSIALLPQEVQDELTKELEALHVLA